MGEPRITKVDLIGQTKTYYIETGGEQHEVKLTPEQAVLNPTDFTSTEKEEFLGAIAKFNEGFPLELERAAKELAALEQKEVDSQLCTLWLFGDSYARHFEPFGRERSSSRVGAIDLNNDGLADMVGFSTTAGIEVMISTHNPYTLTKPSYTYFHCADVDTSRKGVEEYLKPFDRLFELGVSGNVHSMVMSAVNSTGLNIAIIIGHAFYNAALGKGGGVASEMEPDVGSN